MKIGSVKFFKVLIVSVFLLLLVVPLGLSIFFGVLYVGQRRRADVLQEQNTRITEKYLDMTGEGYLPQNEPDAAGVHAPQLAPSFAYQTLYPHLYAPRPTPAPVEEKTCFLTFDDGPSATTRQVLNVLDRYGVKATFFVTGRASEINSEFLQAAAAAGHTIGVHSYSHNYRQIYASVEAFLEDFDKMYRTIEDLAGVAPTVFRFAGGSINVFNSQTYTEIVAEMTRRGFVFFDWNASASDAVAESLPAEQIVQNVLGGCQGLECAVVLMHDRADNATTAAALPDIIQGLQGQGFSFAPLTPQVPPVTYYYVDVPEGAG